MCIKKYMVLDDTERGNGDQFVEYYDTLREANAEAMGAWDYLTDREKESRHIRVGWVERDGSFIQADELNNSDWWEYWHSFNSDESCFDSESGKKKKRKNS